MVIDGVSQSTGVERRSIDVAAAKGGVLLVIRDRFGGVERTRTVAPAGAVLTVLTDRPAGVQTIVGLSGGAYQKLGMEVRRNEVWLTVGTVDAAVGLDDLTDAVAAALPAA